jgi:ubiquitin-protein ligase
LWKIFIKGPAETPFEGGQFEVSFKFDNFPFKAPLVKFETKIYHPNVDNSNENYGGVCTDMI